MELEQLATMISIEKHLPHSEEILKVLSEGSVESRIRANVKLAEACFAAGTPDHLNRAAQFISRAWLLSQHRVELLDLFVKIHERQGAIEVIKNAYKDAGLKKAAEGHVEAALHFFNLWQNAFGHLRQLDKFSYDFEVLNCIKQLAEPDRFFPELNLDSTAGRKIRVAYLAFGLGSPNSLMFKLIKLFSELGNKDEFEIAVCIPDSKSAVHAREVGQQHTNGFEKGGSRVFFAPEATSQDLALRSLASDLHAWKPDLLVTCAALADVHHYYFASLFPAPLRVALHQGPPAQFVPPDFDHAIAWTLHPLIDSPIDCDLIPLEVDLPGADAAQTADLTSIDLPKDAFVISIGGRPQKFQDRNFWKTISKVLERDPNTFLIAAGVQKTFISFIDEIVPAEVQKQIRFLGWRTDYLNFMAASHLVIDTYPSGGGVVPLDVMALGVPFIGFENDYAKPYDQLTWSPMRELIGDHSMILERDNYDELIKTIEAVRKNQTQAKTVAAKNRDHVKANHGSPARMVHRTEALFKNIFEGRKTYFSSTDSKSRPSPELFALERKINRLLIEQKRTNAAIQIHEKHLDLQAQKQHLREEEARLKNWIKYVMDQENGLKDWAERIAVRETRVNERELNYPDLALYHRLKKWKNKIKSIYFSKRRKG